MLCALLPLQPIFSSRKSCRLRCPLVASSFPLPSSKVVLFFSFHFSVRSSHTTARSGCPPEWGLHQGLLRRSATTKPSPRVSRLHARARRLRGAAGADHVMSGLLRIATAIEYIYIYIHSQGQPESVWRLDTRPRVRRSNDPIAAGWQQRTEGCIVLLRHASTPTFSLSESSVSVLQSLYCVPSISLASRTRCSVRCTSEVCRVLCIYIPDV